MIELKENVKVGNRVYAWFSPFKESASKKQKESEFVLEENRKDFLSLKSVNGGYNLIFNGFLVETWFGSIRNV